MLKRAVGSYIDLGGSFAFLMFIRQGANVHGDSFVLGNLSRFLDRLDVYGLRVTNRACEKLRWFRDRLAKLPESEQLSESDASELRELVTEVRTTLLAEAGGLLAYIVGDSRYRSESLADDVWTLFGEHVKVRIPEIARTDFEEAGKCLLFDRPTATAFHLLRGTEAVLREYFQHQTGGTKPKVRMWGPMVDGLKGLAPTVPSSLTNHLDNIREHYRNPTGHPEKVFALQEAQDLFGLCIEVVNRMARSLPVRS